MLLKLRGASDDTKFSEERMAVLPMGEGGGWIWGKPAQGLQCSPKCLSFCGGQSVRGKSLLLDGQTCRGEVRALHAHSFFLDCLVGMTRFISRPVPVCARASSGHISTILCVRVCVVCARAFLTVWQRLVSWHVQWFPACGAFFLRETREQVVAHGLKCGPQETPVAFIQVGGGQLPPLGAAGGEQMEGDMPLDHPPVLRCVHLHDPGVEERHHEVVGGVLCVAALVYPYQAFASGGGGVRATPSPGPWLGAGASPAGQSTQ